MSLSPPESRLCAGCSAGGRVRAPLPPPHPPHPPPTLPPDSRAPGSSTSILVGAWGGVQGADLCWQAGGGPREQNPKDGAGPPPPREPHGSWLHPPQTVIPWKFSLASSDSNKFYAGQHIFSQFPMTGPVGCAARLGELCCLPPPRPLGP